MSFNNTSCVYMDYTKLQICLHDFYIFSSSNTCFLHVFTDNLHVLHDNYMSCQLLGCCMNFDTGSCLFVVHTATQPICSMSRRIYAQGHVKEDIRSRDGCILSSCFWFRIRMGWARGQFQIGEEHWNIVGEAASRGDRARRPCHQPSQSALSITATASTHRGQRRTRTPWTPARRSRHPALGRQLNWEEFSSTPP